MVVERDGEEAERLYSTTENGCGAFDSSNSAVLDLFFRYVRTISDAELEDQLDKSWAADPYFTLKIILHGRDPRDGKGEKDLSVRALRWLRQKDPNLYRKNLQQVVETYGCYVDYLKLAETEDEEAFELSLLAQRLQEDKLGARDAMSLAYKWAPREGKKYDKLARRLAKLLFPGERKPLEAYRKLLAELSGRKRPVVETTLSKRKFDQVSYEALPSKAGTKYRKAFKRNDGDRYQTFLDRVKDATSDEVHNAPRVKSTGVHPHEILKGLCSADDETLELQWRDMVTQLRTRGELTNCLAMCDVSGSMGYGNDNPRPIEVALALSLLLVHVNEGGPWANRVLTFASAPEWINVDTSVKVADQSLMLNGAGWGMGTNIEAGLTLVLQTAVEQKVPADQMPSTLFVFTDMQFNECVSGTTFHQALQSHYAAHGYTVPDVVFWNLSARGTKGIPVESHDTGAALVSGYSGTLMKTFMESPGKFTPVEIMVQSLEPYIPLV